MTETDMTETDMTETKYRQFLDRTMELNDLPGIVIGLSLRGERWIGAAGYRDMERKEPIRPGDIFHCASISKLLTSTAVMKLIDAGALGYDDRLCDVLPDLKFADERAKEIRIWQMLSHTSGIGDIEDYRWEEALTSNQALRDYVYSEEVVKSPLLFEPGKGDYRYSNFAYEILGLIVAVRSAALGESLSYEDFVERYLLGPAGMKDSTMKTFERIGVRPGEECPLITEAIRERNGTCEAGKAMALPYEKAEDGSIVPVKYYTYTRTHGPSSTLTSNAGDLLSWGEANLRGQLLSEDALTHAGYEYATVSNNGEKMGLGWFMREQNGYLLKGHEGG